MDLRLDFAQPDYHHTGVDRCPERHAGLGSGFRRSDERLLYVRQSVVSYEKTRDSKRL